MFDLPPPVAVLRIGHNPALTGLLPLSPSGDAHGPPTVGAQHHHQGATAGRRRGGSRSGVRPRMVREERKVAQRIKLINLSNVLQAGNSKHYLMANPFKLFPYYDRPSSSNGDAFLTAADGISRSHSDAAAGAGAPHHPHHPGWWRELAAGRGLSLPGSPSAMGGRGGRRGDAAGGALSHSTSSLSPQPPPPLRGVHFEDTVAAAASDSGVDAITRAARDVSSQVGSVCVSGGDSSWLYLDETGASLPPFSKLVG